MNAVAETQAKEKRVHLHQTEFQIHTKYVKRLGPNAVDFTERKLIQLIRLTVNSNMSIKLSALLDGYRDGEVAIAWREGAPVYVTINPSPHS